MSCQLSYDRFKYLSLHKIILLKYFSANTASCSWCWRISILLLADTFELLSTSSASGVLIW